MIKQASKEDYKELVEIWEQAIRAIHNFITDEDIIYYRRKIPNDFFPNVRLWKYTVDNEICGFIGLSDMVEMLFVKPSYFRKGIGGRLLDFAVKHERMRRLDVNEQNTGALRFYLSKGFKVVDRSETDSDGKPYPLLHLSL